MGPKMITHTFLIFGNISPVTQDICYTGFSGKIFFCVVRGLHKVLSVKVFITHINCLEINFPIACTFTQKNCFRISCVIISGFIVKALRIGFKITRAKITQELSGH